jgi:hypothetical protein
VEDLFRLYPCLIEQRILAAARVEAGRRRASD